jgi:hypothetical protein
MLNHKNSVSGHNCLSPRGFSCLFQIKPQCFQNIYRDRDRMVVEFTSIYAIRSYHHQRCEIESLSGEVYPIQYDVITFVSDL